MDDKTKGESDEQPQGGTPPQDQQTPPVQGEVEGSEENAAPAVTPQDAPQNEDFPQSEKEQKEAFYKMRQKIKELESKDSQDQEDFDLLNLARGTQDTGQGYTPQETQSQEQFDTSDPATQAFLNQVQQSKQEAFEARQDSAKTRAQMEDFEAWQKFPFLNPKSTKTDEQKMFVDDVQKEYISSKLKAVAQGKATPRLVEVAEKVQTRYEKIRGQVKEQANEEAAATQAAKSQASQESRGTQVNLREQGGSDDELRRRSNRGDIDATAELLKKTDAFLADWPE